MNRTLITTGAIFLTGIGCLQMIGDLTGNVPLKAIGAASHASPAPRVFTAHQGFETFSSRFFVTWADARGQTHMLELTPATYGRLRGPYNRRNAYGAALSYGPVLSANPATRPMFERISHYALCNKAPVLREVGFDPSTIASPVTMTLLPREQQSASDGWQLRFDIDCAIDIDSKKENAS